MIKIEWMIRGLVEVLFVAVAAAFLTSACFAQAAPDLHGTRFLEQALWIKAVFA